MASVTPASLEPPPGDAPDLETVGAALMQALAAERRDEAWASTKESALEGVVERADLPTGSVVSARCGTSICRVELRLPPGGIQKSISAVRFDDAFATSGFVTSDPDDPAVVVVFVGREDTVLNEHPGFLRELAKRAPRQG